MFQRPSVTREAAKKLMWVGHVGRKNGAMIKAIFKEDLIGKRPLYRPCVRWEHCMKRDIKVVDPRANWRKVAKDRYR